MRRENESQRRLWLGDKPSRQMKTNVIYQGDNLPILKQLESNKVDLCYIDPPFCSQSIQKSKAWNKKIVSFQDQWGGGVQSYIHWLSPRLKEMHRILRDTGIFCLHLDYRSVHYAKVELDKIFGYDHFINEVIVKRKTKSINSQFEKLNSLNIATDSLLFYRKSKKTKLKKIQKSQKINQKGKWQNFWNNADRPTMRYAICGLHRKTGQWRWNKERGLKAEKNYNEFLKNHKDKLLEQYWIETGKKLEFVKRDKNSSTCYYWQPPKDKMDILSTNWLDFYAYDNRPNAYPTKKSFELMRRIIEMTTEKNNLVFDAFCGCGTTINVAEKIGRKWCGIDVSKDAISEIKRRMFDEHNLKIQLIKTGSLSKDNILRLDPFKFERYIVSLIGQPNLKQRGDGGVDWLHLQSYSDTGQKEL